MNLIRSFDWRNLASLFFNGLLKTGLDDSDSGLDNEDDMSVSLQCSQALIFLTQIVQDEILDITIQFVNQVLGQEGSQENWQLQYIALVALNSTMEGVSVQKIYNDYDQIMNWIYGNTQSQFPRVRTASASLLSKIALFCPNLFIKDQQS